MLRKTKPNWYDRTGQGSWCPSPVASCISGSSKAGTRALSRKMLENLTACSACGPWRPWASSASLSTPCAMRAASAQDTDSLDKTAVKLRHAFAGGASCSTAASRTVCAFQAGGGQGGDDCGRDSFTFASICPRMDFHEFSLKGVPPLAADCWRMESQTASSFADEASLNSESAVTENVVASVRVESNFDALPARSARTCCSTEVAAKAWLP
mmetsp:Transcript_32473/g.106990  ORF Transcript_32473/g.106990 Transcript_32473/m.106990 type:complete len:212 (-) Transcript_32473:1554-2189(-)